MPPRGPISAPTAGDVLGLIRSGQAATRSDVARRTGLSRTAVTARLSALIRAGLVVEGEEGPSTGGRPPTRLRFNREAGVVLAGAIGRSRSQLAVCDLEGEVKAASEFEQEDRVGPEELMPRVVAGFADLLQTLGLTAEDVRAVGLSIPGTVDTDRGASLDSPIMRGWDGVPLAPYLSGICDAPVQVENDVNAMALSERRGHLDRFTDVLVVKAATGIGAGVVTGRRLLRGAVGAAGEIGHTKSPAAEGRPCRCGDTGCLEAVAGGWALAKAMSEAGHPVAHVRELLALAAAGDPMARNLVRESGRRVGEVLAGAVNLLNPQAVIVGGDMAAAYDTFVAGLRETLYANATALASRELEILPSTYGERAGVVGCAVLALERLLSADAVDLSLAGTSGRRAARST